MPRTALWRALVLGSLLLVVQLAQTATAAPAPAPVSTVQLIDAAFAAGQIGAEQRLTYLGYAIFEPLSLPEHLRGNKGWDATHALQEIRAAVRANEASWRPRLSAQATGELSRILQQAAALCSKPDGATTVESANFRVSYTEIGGGLTAQEYLDALERSYTVEVTQFGWPRPPLGAANTFGKYPVQVVNPAGTGLGDVYGYVDPEGGSFAGPVGDNPNSPQVETAAYASCMVINDDLGRIVGSASIEKLRSALNVTAAHEFWHAIQVGQGDPGATESLAWQESIPPYVESEVFPGTDDFYQYLWPRFRDCLTNYTVDSATNSHYSNWMLFRYAAERYGGVNKPGGGEDITQAWMVNVAAGQRAVEAYANALLTKGANLNDVFHNYAIASRFVKNCPQGAPYCYEEGDRMRAYKATDPIADDGRVEDIGQAYSGSIKNSYAINYVALPTSGTYGVTVRNSSSGGALRASIVADLGSSLEVIALSGTARGQGAISVGAYRVPSGAQAVSLVLTNQDLQDNYDSSCAADAYEVALGTASGPPATPVPVATPLPLPVASNPSGRVHAPLVVKNAGLGAIPGVFNSSIVVANPGATDASVRLTLVKDDGGAALAAPVEFTVKAGASRNAYVPNVAGLADGRYAALIDADQPVAAIVNLASTSPSTSASYSGVTGADAGTTSYVPSVYRNYFGFSSSVVVQNVGTAAASVTVTYKKPGAADVSETRSVPAGAAESFDQATARGLPDGFIGSAVVSSDQPVAAVFNVSGTRPTAQLSSGNGIKAGATTVSVPVVYNQYFDYNTSVLVQNVDAASASVTITYYDSRTGRAAGSQQATVQPGASQLFLQFDPGGRPAAVPIGFNGSAVVTSAEGRRLVAVANVQNARSGYLSTYNAAAADGATDRASCAAILKGYYGYSTSLTVQNSGSTETDLTIGYVDAQGRQVDSVEVRSLKPGATYFSYTPGNPRLPVGFNGAAVINAAGGKIVAVVNELLGTGAAGDQLFTYNCVAG